MKKVVLTLVLLCMATLTMVYAQTATPIKYDTTALKSYIGNYNIAAAGQRSKLVIKNGKLYSIGDEDYELVPTTKEHIFEIGGGSFVVTFILDDKKVATKAIVKTNDGQEFEAVKEQ